MRPGPQGFPRACERPALGLYGRNDREGFPRACETAGSYSDDDPARLNAITTQAITEQGSGGFGYVAAAALRITIECLLAPTLRVTDTAGIDLRTALHDGLRNAERQTGHHN